MAGWYKKSFRKATMGQWGREDLYVAFRDINSLPYGEAMGMLRKFEALQKMDEETVNAESTDELFKQLIDLIVEWHMEHPTQDGVIERPTTPEDLHVFPMDVLMYLIEVALSTNKDESGKTTELIPLESEIKPELTPVG